MPKFPTFPRLFEDCKTIKIANLKKWDYLHPNQQKSGSITWSRDGVETSSISIYANTITNHPFIELSYTYNHDIPVKYQIDLVSIPSNLGKGLIWYFLCPITKKKCRIIYLVDTYFLHREAFKGCFYEKQIQSNKYRFIEKNLGAYFESDHIYDQLYKKHFKKYYAGKPTKRYKKLISKLKKAESITKDEIELLMLKT